MNKIDTALIKTQVMKGLQKFRNQNTLINEIFPAIKVNTLNGFIPTSRDATAYNLKNFYSGDAINNIVNEGYDTDKIAFSMEPRDYYTGVSYNRLLKLTNLLMTQQEAGRMVVDDLMNGITERGRLLKEDDLSVLLQKESNYLSINIKDSTSKKIQEWTADDVAVMVEAIATMKININKAVGGGLFDDKGQYSADSEGMKTVMIIPLQVWAAITSNLKAFNEYISYNGNVGNYRTVTEEMFKTLFGLDVYIGSGFKLKKVAENENVYDVANIEDIWSANNIYIATISSNLLDKAGVKVLQYGEPELFDYQRFGDVFFLSKNITMPLLNNKGGNALIKVKIA